MTSAERAAVGREAETTLRRQARQAEERGDYRAAALLRQVADS